MVQLNPMERTHLEGTMVSGGQALLGALSEEGVEYLFGYPGGATLHIYDAIFTQQLIEHILVRHEQAAVHMADGYSRSTGKPGVVLVTSGPGATNAITGIATAYMDSIPLLVLSGQVPLEQIGTDAFQETDMIGLSRPIVKHSFLVMTPESIPEIVGRAFHIMTTGRPGPVLIDLPKDVTDPKIKFPYTRPKKIQLRSYKPAEKGDQDQIRQATDLLLSAKRPIIYVGGGVILADASESLTALARQLNFPVTQTLMGLGAFPATDSQNLGMLGMHGTYEANMAMHNADVIFAVGARFDDRVTNDPAKFCPQAKIIHLDVDPASVAKIVPVDIALVGSAKSILSDMVSMLEAKSPQEAIDQNALSSWWKQLHDWRTRYGLNHGLKQTPEQRLILPQQVIQSLYQVTEGKAYVASDVGQHQMFAAQYYHFDEPRKWINSGGLGTMGFGLPAAMGVALAHPDACSVVVTGEGSIQMNIQELSTCTQYGLAIKIINVNNQALGMVKQWQDINYGGRHSHSTYEGSLPDFVALAESYGHIGIRVSDPAELMPAMVRTFSKELADKLVFLDVLVDPEEHVYPMAIKGGAINEMYLSKTEKT